MSNATLTTSLNDRQTHGLKLVTSGVRRINEGLKILIDEQGMSVPQVHRHLLELGYEDLSVHQLKRIATTMRKAGELEPATEGAAVHKPVAQICSTPVENSSTTVCSQSSRHDQPSHTEPSIRSSVPAVQPIDRRWW